MNYYAVIYVKRRPDEGADEKNPFYVFNYTTFEYSSDNTNLFVSILSRYLTTCCQISIQFSLTCSFNSGCKFCGKTDEFRWRYSYILKIPTFLFPPKGSHIPQTYQALRDKRNLPLPSCCKYSVTDKPNYRFDNIIHHIGNIILYLQIVGPPEEGRRRIKANRKVHASDKNQGKLDNLLFVSYHLSINAL
jgi:hypothetical protein